MNGAPFRLPVVTVPHAIKQSAELTCLNNISSAANTFSSAAASRRSCEWIGKRMSQRQNASIAAAFAAARIPRSAGGADSRRHSGSSGADTLLPRQLPGRPSRDTSRRMAAAKAGCGMCRSTVPCAAATAAQSRCASSAAAVRNHAAAICKQLLLYGHVDSVNAATCTCKFFRKYLTPR
jgi:hypothetical protein